MNERILFVDRDGTILEEPEDFQVDRFEKMRFVEGVLPALKRLREAGWKLVMVSNQDGLGTKSFPRADFTGPHELMMQILESQGARFDEVLICPHMPGEGCECRKPGTGLVKKYLKDGVLDVANCYVIGDRETDMKLADNMGLRGLRVGPDGRSWAEIADEIENAAKSARHARVERNTKETRIVVEAWLDRSGKNEINTGVGFFNHMLTQIAVHGGIRLHVRAVGDLEIDDHHTIEDVGLALGEALKEALGDKRGIRRFGSIALPMDETLVLAACDLSGRGQLHWDVPVPPVMLGAFDASLAKEFFIAFAANAGVTLHVRLLAGENAHHIIEACFKAAARALREAVEPDPRLGDELPSTKGAL